MVNIVELGQLIGEEIAFNPGVCLYPGKFKPPHKGHFTVVQDLSSKNYITKVVVLISSKTVDGITAQQSLDIWKQYLQADPEPKVEVSICDTDSPVKDIYNYINSHLEDKTFYIVGGADEEDDQKYLESLQKSFGDKVKPLPMQEKAGVVSAPYVRDLLRSGNYEDFKKTLPDAAVNKGYGPGIFKMLAGDVVKRELKENIVPEVEQVKIALPDVYSSVEGLKKVLNMQGYDLVKLQDTSIEPIIERFAEWCCMMLEIQNIPPINLIPDVEFSKRECSFGGYDPATNIIHLAIHGRHVVDTLRTLAHELVHCKQNESSGISLEDGKTGSYVENEANATAGMIMREYGRRNPHLYTGELTEGAPGTFKSKITKAYGGKATIEKAKKFKARKNATTLDKKQANWFINMHSK